MSFEKMFKEVEKIRSMALALSVALEVGDEYACACAEFHPTAEEIQSRLEDLKISMKRVMDSGSIKIVG